MKEPGSWSLEYEEQSSSPLHMPFKSKAQRRKFAQMLVDGEITPEVYEEWNRETGGAHLPERVTRKPRKPARPRRKRKTTRAKASTRKKRVRAGTRPGSAKKKRSITKRRAARR
jgi:hypothetical protein